MPRAINPEKLMLSKWTAAEPQHKEKHFLVIAVVRDEEEQVQECTLQAVMTKNEYNMAWRALQDQSVWLQGWL